MILFFDTETTGLPKDYKAPLSDSANWPRLVQLAWMQYEDNGDFISEGSCIIQPVDFVIPDEAASIHGITTEKALLEGIDIKKVMTVFAKMITEASYFVGHNISFDRKIIGAELLRNGIEDVLHGKPRICTMWKSRSFVQAKNKKGVVKIPNLQELHTKLFGEPFEGAHNALADIQATAKSFFALRLIGVITDEIIKKEVEREFSI